MKKILFISHQASYTGAPRSLLRLMRWLKENANIPLVTLQKEGGSLQNQFEKLGTVFNFQTEEFKSSLLSKVAKKTGISSYRNSRHLKKLKKKLIQEDIGLIYANTITNGQVLKFLLDFLECPVICHVRELEISIRYHKDFELVKKYTQQYIAISELVKSNLVKNHGISGENIEVIYNGLPIVTASLEKKLKIQKQVRENLNIPDEAKIVCGCGVITWHKGADLFVQLARSIINQSNSSFPIYFLWIGKKHEHSYRAQISYDINQLGLENYVRFLGLKSNPFDYFTCCDVFVLPSREEPFGMVGIEAASLAKPIVCFDGAVGIKEFIEDDSGFVVPYLDIEAMATKVVDLLKSTQLRQKLGQTAQTKVRQQHDIEVVAPKILKIINQYLKN